MGYLQPPIFNFPSRSPTPHQRCMACSTVISLVSNHLPKAVKSIANEPVIFKQARMICCLRFWKPIVMSLSKKRNQPQSKRSAGLSEHFSIMADQPASTHIDRTARIQLLEKISRLLQSVAMNVSARRMSVSRASLSRVSGADVGYLEVEMDQHRTQGCVFLVGPCLR